MQRTGALLQTDRGPAKAPTSERVKLVFYTHALVGGGAERVWAQLASGFAEAGAEVILVVDYEAEENRSFVDPRVKIMVLGGGHIANVVRLRALIARERPDAILSALSISNLKAFLAAFGAGALDRAILSYHGFAESEPQRLSRLSYRLTPLLTRFAAATVAVSDGLRDDLVQTWGARRERLLRIYNPSSCGTVDPPTREDLLSRPRSVLAVGRLDENKNFADLVRAFADPRLSDARLVILGEGPERGRLAKLVEDLGLGARVALPGYVGAPWAHYAGARCLALTSRSEAFSLVVVEALAHGLPIVSTDCRGPREILDNGRFGALVPIGDPKALAAAIRTALDEPGDPSPRVRRAQDFSLEAARAAYGALIDRIRMRS